MTGEALLDRSRDYEGDAYVLGVRTPLTVDYHGPVDCAQHVSRVVWQITGQLLGIVSGTPTMADAYTGQWWADMLAARCRGTTVDDAIRTPGAILLRKPPETPGRYGHIVFSDGRGGTSEAMDSKHGVCAAKATGRVWDTGILVHGVRYTPGPPIDPRAPSGYLRRGSRGPEVQTLQRRLGVEADGIFGVNTEAAVVKAQVRFGLVPDGIVGPKTLSALGL